MQAAIDETGEHSRQMVDIAIKSGKSIQENLEEMNVLKGLAEQTRNSTEEIRGIISVEEVKEAIGLIQKRTGLYIEAVIH